MQQPQIYRVEVLSQDTQKYASTQVHGGGGHVTTINGVTAGRLDEVRSTTTFHQDQALWVKDLLTGKEMHLEFKDFSLAARSGHVLTVLFDPVSQQCERLVNETANTFSHGTGKFNPAVAQAYARQGATGFVLGVGLLIPLLNWLMGLVALVFTYKVMPVKHSGIGIPGAWRRVLLSLPVGLATFVGSFLVLAAMAKSTSWLVGFPAGAASLFAAFMYGKLWKQSFDEAGRVVLERSEQLDAALESFRKQHSTIAAMQVDA